MLVGVAMLGELCGMLCVAVSSPFTLSKMREMHEYKIPDGKVTMQETQYLPKE